MVSITGRDYWWQKPKGQAHDAIVEAVRYIDTNYGDRRALNEQNLRLYGNRNFSGFGPSQYYKYSTAWGYEPRLKLNIVKSVIDTNTAEHAGSKPKPMFLTIGGDFSLQRKGKNLGRFVSGIYYQTGLYEIAHEVRRDRGIFGTGGVKVWGEVTPIGKGRIHSKRFFSDDVLVDEQEARTGEPRQLFYVLPCAKDWVGAKWPKEKAGIIQAGLVRKGDSRRQDGTTLTDMLSLIEAWHLPSGDGTKDGRHVICVDGATLLDEAWTSERFPFAFARRNKQPLGFWGYGIAEEITPIQVEVNDILEYMESIISYHAPHILLPRGSKVNKAHIDNVAWSIIEYLGEKPEWLVPAMFPAGLIDYLERRIRAAYEITGTNLLLAQSQKPAGLNSGKALDSFNDTGSKRAQVDGLNDQDWFLECADLMIDSAKWVDEEMRKRNLGGFEVMSVGPRSLERIKWSEVDMDRDSYKMQAFPVSFFSSTPSEKWNQIADMMERGAMTPEEARSQMDWPDTEEWAARQNAPYDVIRMQLEDIVEHGLPAEVEPFHNHALIMQIAPKALYQAQRDGVPQERQELIRRMILDAQDWIAKTQPLPQASQGATPLTHRAPIEAPPGFAPTPGPVAAPPPLQP